MRALHDAFGSYEAAWRVSANALVGARVCGRKLAESIIPARAGLDPQALWEADRPLNARFVMLGDSDYPDVLTDLADPPPALWVRGAWPIPERAIAVVGARSASPYGERMARRLAAGLAASDVVVVSGAAAGIDRAAHEGAIGAPGGWTVGVLGCGLRHVYPAHHRALYHAILAAGTLISEFPPEAPPTQGSFPRRNRLIAALARGVIVVESRAKSGSLITVDFAADLGREIFAVPGPAGAPGSEGPHGLLRDGATMVESAADVLAALGWVAAPVQAMPLAVSASEGLLLAALGANDDAQSMSMDRLMAATGLTAAQAGAALVSLELAGLATGHPGARWARA